MAFVPMIAGAALTTWPHVVMIACCVDPRTNGSAWIVKKIARIDVFSVLKKKSKMLVCTKDCLPFQTCQLSEKARKKRVCQYPERPRRLVWIKAMMKQTDKEMEKYKNGKRN